MEARLTDRALPEDVLAEAGTVYARAFGQPPYNEGPEYAQAFRDGVRRFGAERDGFRFVTVRDNDNGNDNGNDRAGRLVAFGLAVLARPGDGWRDQIAAAVGRADEERWLGPLCLEVIEVAVEPERHGRGLGRLVHDMLIAGSPAPTGVLACHPEAEPARRLYLGRGWTLLANRLPSKNGDEGSLLMARRL